MKEMNLLSVFFIQIRNSQMAGGVPGRINVPMPRSWENKMENLRKSKIINFLVFRRDEIIKIVIWILLYGEDMICF